MNEAPQGARPTKFKHTRELVRLALNDGMTQDEIGRLCRVQQSVVSGWANGKSKAKEEVLTPLLTRYGHRLNRTSGGTYLILGTPEVPWENTDEGRLIGRMRDDPENYIREVGTEEEIKELEIAIERAVHKLRLSPENRRPEAIAREEARRIAHSNAVGRVDSAAVPQSEGSDLQGVPRPPQVAEPPKGVTRPSSSDFGNWKERTPRKIGGFSEKFTSEDYLPVTETMTRAAIRQVPFPRLRCIVRTGRKLDSDWEGSNIGQLAANLKWEHAQRTVRIVRIEGAQLWVHYQRLPELVRRREGVNDEYDEAALRTVARWLVLRAGSGQFRLVVQWVRRLLGSDREKWRRSVRAKGSMENHPGQESYVPIRYDSDVRSDEDFTRWVGVVYGPVDFAGLAKTVDRLLLDAGPHDRATVPFTLRKALVEHGYDVPGVETLTD